jgi:hypothetical protein
MVVTLAVFHAPMLPLKAGAIWNSHFETVKFSTPHGMSHPLPGRSGKRRLARLRGDGVAVNGKTA